MSIEPERYYDWMLWKIRQEEANTGALPYGYPAGPYDELDTIGIDKKQELYKVYANKE